MRIRLLGLLALLLPLTACTPTQINAWLRWHHESPADAQAFLDEHIATNGPIVVEYGGNPGGQCSEWYEVAIDAGFTHDQWLHLAPIMYRESRCQERAYNPSGASGLLQIMPMWAGSCGLVPAQLLEAWHNLRCGVHILQVQGWGAWAL